MKLWLLIALTAAVSLLCLASVMSMFCYAWFGTVTWKIPLDGFRDLLVPLFHIAPFLLCAICADAWTRRR